MTGIGEHEQELHHEDHPREDRHPHQLHAGRTHVEHGDDQVDRAGQRGDAGDLQAESPEVDAVARREQRVGVRLVHEPAAVGSAAEEPRRVEEDAAEQQAPEAERVHAWERDVASADLQRHEVVREAGRHRHDEEEDHRRGVHREHLVVEVGAEHLAVRAGELRADQQCLDATDDEEHERRDHVHDPELLVVDGEQPRAPPGGADRAAQDTHRLAGRDDGGARAARRAPVSGRSMMAISSSVTFARAGRRSAESIWSSLRLRLGMPRILPPLSSLAWSPTYIGFLPGALRSHSRSSTWLRHSGVTPWRYSAPNSSGGAFHTRSRHSSVSRSKLAPAKVLRVIRLVRLGAAPETTNSSGLASTGVVVAVGVGGRQPVDLVAVRRSWR